MESHLKKIGSIIIRGDFAEKHTDMYYVSVEPSGKLGWRSDTLTNAVWKECL